MEENFISNLLKRPLWMIFLISWLFYLIGLFLFSYMVWDTNTYQISYSGNDFDSALASYRRIDLIRYVFSPLWILTLSSVVWFLLKIGLTITQTEIKTNTLVKIILLGTIFLALPYWVKSVWFVLIKSSYTPEDLKQAFPGTIVSLINTSGMSESKIKALSMINVYHLGFIIFSAWAITKNSISSYLKSFFVVFATYGTGVLAINLLRVYFF